VGLIREWSWNLSKEAVVVSREEDWSCWYQRWRRVYRIEERREFLEKRRTQV